MMKKLLLLLLLLAVFFSFLNQYGFTPDYSAYSMTKVCEQLPTYNIGDLKDTKVLYLSSTPIVLDYYSNQKVSIPCSGITIPSFPVMDSTGTKVAYRPYSDPNLWIYTTETGGAVQIPLGYTGSRWEWDHHNIPRFSPDGEQLGYLHSISSNNYSLSVADTDGSWKKDLMTGIADLSYYDWNPDNKRIAILAKEGGNERSSIYIVDSADSDIIKIKENVETKQSILDGLYLWNPVGLDGLCQWNPAGTNIAYISAGNIFTITADGSQERQVTDDGNTFFLQWSPTGDKIAYLTRDGLGQEYETGHVKKGEYSRLHLINPDGTGHEEIFAEYTEGYLNELPFTWAEDGKGIILFNIEGGYLMDLEKPAGYEPALIALVALGVAIVACTVSIILEYDRRA